MVFFQLAFIMDVKALFYILLLLFTISSAEDVQLNVKGVTNIATTDDNFICATLDWWPENKCDYNQCPWGKAGILNLVHLPLIMIHAYFHLIVFLIQNLFMYLTYVMHFQHLQDLGNRILSNAVKGIIQFSQPNPSPKDKRIIIFSWVALID